MGCFRIEAGLNQQAFRLHKDKGGRTRLLNYLSCCMAVPQRIDKGNQKGNKPEQIGMNEA